MSVTRSGEFVSPQIAMMGNIDNLANKNFTLANGQVFNIKNEASSPVKLQVQLAAMDDGEFIETTFESGWNPEIVKSVKQTSLAGLNLKFGY